MDDPAGEPRRAARRRARARARPRRSRSAAPESAARRPRRASRRSGSASRRRRSGLPATTSVQSCGSRTLDDRAKVSRANSSRRAAPIRVEMSSTCSSMARAARRLASSASCRFFSLSSSLAATSVAGAASPDFGVSSARRLAEAASRGVRSAIAPSSARASGSFWARSAAGRRRWRSCPGAPLRSRRAPRASGRDRAGARPAPRPARAPRGRGRRTAPRTAQ